MLSRSSLSICNPFNRDRSRKLDKETILRTNIRRQLTGFLFDIHSILCVCVRCGAGGGCGGDVTIGRVGLAHPNLHHKSLIMESSIIFFECTFGQMTPFPA